MWGGPSRMLLVGALLFIVVLVIGALVVGDDDVDPRGGAPPLSFDPEGDDVFATGSFRGAQWEAAAGYTVPPGSAREGDRPVLCLAMRWDPPETSPRRDTCSTSLADPVGAIEFRRILVADGGGVGLLGVVGDTVDRLEWQLADPVVEVEVHDHPVVLPRVFSAVEVVEESSLLVAFDADGRELATEQIVPVDGGAGPSAEADGGTS